MPGPMSIPNGNTAQTVKFIDDDGDEYWVAISDLTGEQRAYLASRGRLHTGKTKKKGGAS